MGGVCSIYYTTLILKFIFYILWPNAMARNPALYLKGTVFISQF
jgi:hypothetical protein